MNNSFAVAHAVVEDFRSGTIREETRPGFNALQIKSDVVTWEGWQRIDKVESQAAADVEGKPREKIIDITKMLEIAIV